jgi:RND family efflux transporter MFP subunit
MRRPIKIILPIVIFFTASSIAWQLLANNPKVKRERVAYRPPLVETLDARPQDLSIPIVTQGTIKPRTSIKLSGEVSGHIVATAAQFAAGAFFKKDDVLARIEAHDYELAITKAEALVASGRQQLTQAEAEYKQKLEEYRGVNRSQVSDYALRKPQYEEAAAKLKAAEADLELARLQLQRCEIRAPFDGRVIEKIGDIGQYVTPGATIATIYAIDFAEVRLPLSQAQANLLDLPPPYLENSASSGITVNLLGKSAGQNSIWEGEIVRTEALVDERNRLLYVVAQVRDPYGLRATQYGLKNNKPPLAMGMFVQGEIQSRVIKDIYLLPNNAVHYKNTVWLMDENSRLQIRSVYVTHRDEQNAYISDGLNPGDTVIISALDAAVAGMRLSVTSNKF